MKEMKITKPLTEETLTQKEVYELVKLNKNTDPNKLVFINKGYFISWDDEIHDGYIVTCNEPDPIMSTEYIKYYFMETTEELSNMSLKYGKLYFVNYHKLIPINQGDKYEIDSTNSPINEVSKFIVNNAYDRFGLHKDENGDFIPLSNSPLFRTYKPLSEDEKCKLEIIRDMEQNIIIERFKRDDLPKPEDSIWYRCLADIDSRGIGDYTFENTIIDILKQNKHKVRIDGEKDSCGWVTRGIIVDDEWMCCM